MTNNLWNIVYGGIRYGLTAILLAVLTVLSGCSDSTPPEPPLAAMELMARLGEAMQSQRYEEALQLLGKLEAVDPDNNAIPEMRIRLIGNCCVRGVQTRVDQGEIEDAIALVQTYRKNYPSILRLKQLEDELGGLLQLDQAAKMLRQAQTIPELSEALQTIEPLIERYPDAAALKKDIANKRAALVRLQEKEAQEIARKSKPLPSKTPEPTPDKPSPQPAEKK